MSTPAYARGRWARFRGDGWPGTGGGAPPPPAPPLNREAGIFRGSRAAAAAKGRPPTSMNGDYDAYYTSYLEQLSDLSGKIETYGDTLENEYLALLSAISDSYETIQ